MFRRKNNQRPSAPARRLSVNPEPLEGRLLFSVPEPNNSFAQAYTPQDNIYLEQNLYATDAVSTASDGDDYFKFYNLYGKSHLYAALNGLSSDADLYVYDTNGNQVASSTAGSNASETINVDLAGNQYFYVRVRAFSGATNYGLYLYNDYAGSSMATARDIGVSWGQSSDKFYAYDKAFSDDYLDFRDNVDYVKFRMEAPGTISLRMKDFTYTGGLVARMQLLDSGGNVLRDVAGTVGDGLNVDRYSLPAGDYYVKFTQITGSDPYTFRIVSDYAGDTTATARNLGDVTNSSRQLFDMVSNFGGPTYDDALDLYKFNLTKATPLDLRLTIPAAFPAPTFDADLYLAQDTNFNGFIDSGEIINQSVNPGNDSLSYPTLNAGTYYVGVKQAGAYTSYQLDLDSDIDVPFASSSPFNDMSDAQSFGTLQGNVSFDGGFGISLGDQSDFYKFTVPVTGKVTVGAAKNSFWSRDTSNRPFVSIVRDANQNFLADAGENVASGAGGVTANLTAGTYYLRLSGSGQQMAYFGQITADLAGNSLGAARAAANISNGSPATQTFRDYIEQDFGGANDVDDYYSFNLAQGHTVTLRTTGVSGEDLSLSLIRDANNNGVIDSAEILATSNALNSPTETISRTLDAGRYFARVHGINGGTNYTLTLGAAPTGDPDDTFAEANVKAGSTVPVGGSVNFNISPDAKDVDIIRFTAAAGQRIGFDFDRTAGTVDSYLRLFKADGTQLATNNNAAAPGEAAGSDSYLAYTFASAGTYYLGVSASANTAYSPVTGNGDVAGGSTGSYKLSLVNLSTARISGTVFRDANGNRVRDAGEAGLFNWTVFIDADQDGVLDASERRVTTDSSGNYSFANLAAGTYRVRVLQQANYALTTPTAGYHSVSLVTGQVVTGKLFGERPV